MEPSLEFYGTLVENHCRISVTSMNDVGVPDGPSAVYSLFAVSNHTGSVVSGHYTAYTKHPYSNKWHYFNDARYVRIIFLFSVTILSCAISYAYRTVMFFGLNDLSLCLCMFCFTLDSLVISGHVLALA